MQAPDQVEAILARLMPPGLSGGGQASIEAMLDDLAAEEAAELAVPVISRPAPGRSWIYGGIAAAVILCATVTALVAPRFGGDLQVSDAGSPGAPEVVWVEASGRIESMTDEGWREDTDGSALQALSMNVVEENDLLDSETGIVMKVAETRGELLLMPVSAF